MGDKELTKIEQRIKFEVLNKSYDEWGYFDEDKFLDIFREFIKPITEKGYIITPVLVRPICTENERRFLDRIREFEYTGFNGDTQDALYLAPGGSMMLSEDFPDVNLKELVDASEEP